MKVVMTLWAFACISGCTTGTAVVTGQERSPIDPSTVTVYDEPPADYEVVGIVEAASDVIFLAREAAQERAFAELREQAASIGANGVIDWEVGETSQMVSHYDANTGITSPRMQITSTVKGRAIYVSPISLNE